MIIQINQLLSNTANKKGIINLNPFKYYSTFDDTYTHCKKQILLLKKSKKFYIGATHDYEERLLEHMKNKKMFNMYILTLAPTKNKSKKIEQKLIKRFGKNPKNLNGVKYDINGNILNGGGGEGINHDYNYIYVLFK